MQQKVKPKAVFGKENKKASGTFCLGLGRGEGTLKVILAQGRPPLISCQPPPSPWEEAG